MKTSLKTRALALVASFLVTATMVHLIASYALPEGPAPYWPRPRHAVDGAALRRAALPASLW